MNSREFFETLKNNSYIFEKISDKCQNYLYSLPQAKQTLEYSLNRNISENTIKKYKFGYFPQEHELSLFSNEEKEWLLKTNILYKSYNKKFYKSLFCNHTLVFPLIDDYGYYIGLISRTIDDKFCSECEQPKYKHNNFQKNFFLFGLNFAKNFIKDNSIIIVEGQIDKIMLDQYGYHNVIALGSSNLSFYHIFLLKKYGIKKIYLLLDNDNPGQKARKRIEKNNLLISNFDIKNIYIPNKYKDIDLYLRNEKEHSFLEEDI